VEVAAMPETTALGAAAAAAIGVGLFAVEDLAELTAGGRRIEPVDAAGGERDYRVWRRFAERAAEL
jgi:glycerol kinase